MQEVKWLRFIENFDIWESIIHLWTVVSHWTKSSQITFGSWKIIPDKSFKQSQTIVEIWNFFTNWLIQTKIIHVNVSKTSFITKEIVSIISKCQKPLNRLLKRLERPDIVKCEAEVAGTVIKTGKCGRVASNFCSLIVLLSWNFKKLVHPH